MRRIAPAISCLVLFAGATPLAAQSLPSRTPDATAAKPRWATFASHEGNIAFLATGVLLPLVTDGSQGVNRSLRTADVIVTSALLTEGFKRVFREPRPDGTTDSFSFPSGHAAAAFAVASYRSRYHPKEAIFWYAGATAIAASRVKLKRHRPRDVVAGALVGTGTSALETGARRGLVISPFVTVDSQNRLSLGFGGTF